MNEQGTVCADCSRPMLFVNPGSGDRFCPPCVVDGHRRFHALRLTPAGLSQRDRAKMHRHLATGVWHYDTP